jgi:CHAT domain-containing protein
MVDGIGGLQRAFKKAGVSTIIMSLWEVSDIATSYFMQQFYKSLFITKSKSKAFIQAQQQTKEKFEDPYYWASFIMLD